MQVLVYMQACRRAIFEKKGAVEEQFSKKGAGYVFRIMYPAPFIGPFY